MKYKYNFSIENGLAQSRVKSYWDNRSRKQGDRTTGPNNWNMSRQNKIYNKRISLFKKNIALGLNTIDYGCGTGRYSHLFHTNRYLGVDICERLINIAQINNPSYTYLLLKHPYLHNIKFNCEMIFMSTVLQHNDDNGVETILQSFAKTMRKNSIICIYENTSKKTSMNHICFRSIEHYIDLISNIFCVCDYKSHTHIIHDQHHSLISAKVRVPQ